VTTSDRCAGCAYPATTTPADAVTLVATAPDRYAALFAGHSPAAAARIPSLGVWPPVAYLWHVTDVLRFGAERLWMLTLDPTSTVVPWDADDIADARGYPRLSVTVGLHALARARDTWLDAYAATPPEAAAPHPEIGRMTAAVMADRNAHEVVHHATDIARILELGAPPQPR
jgi:DinB superfamily